MPVIPIDHPSQAQDAEFVVCVATAELPNPKVVDARKGHCRECGAEVWVSPRTPHHLPIMCEGCAIALVIKDGEEPVVYMNRQHYEEMENDSDKEN